MKKVVCFLLLFVLLCSFAAIPSFAFDGTVTDSFTVAPEDVKLLDAALPEGYTVYFGAYYGGFTYGLYDRLPIRECLAQSTCLHLYFLKDSYDWDLTYAINPKYGAVNQGQDLPRIQHFYDHLNAGSALLESISVDAEISEIFCVSEAYAYIFYVTDQGEYVLISYGDGKEDDKEYFLPAEVLYDAYRDYVDSLIPGVIGGGGDFDLESLSAYEVDLAALSAGSASEPAVPENSLPEPVPLAAGGGDVLADADGAVGTEQTLPAALKIAVAVVTVGLIAAALLVFFRKRNEENIIG